MNRAKLCCVFVVSSLLLTVAAHADVSLVPVNDPKSGISGAKLFQVGEKDKDADWFLPLNDFRWHSYNDEQSMKPNAPILGLQLEGENWAIPWAPMRRHHVANLSLNGKPVLILVCKKCNSAIARDPVIDGRHLTFHVAGLYNGSYLVADYETNTYWTPFTGEALEGPLKGKKLKQIPILRCVWKQWAQLHREGFMVQVPSALKRDRDQVRSPETDVDFFELLLEPLDQRLPADEIVLGVEVANKMRAYPLGALDRQTDAKDITLNDTIEGKPVLILYQRDTWLATALDRRVRGKTLEFTTDKDGRLVDSIYHSHWNYDGEALDGPAAGKKLAHVNSQVENWYIWAAFHRATSVYGLHGAPAPANQPGSAGVGN